MFKCNECDRIYQDNTADGCCLNGECFGSPLVEVKNGSQPSHEAAPVEGLCILVCDSSLSMDLGAFGDGSAEKLKIVAGAIRSAIGGLQNMAKADNAYIAIVGFGAHAKLVLDRNGQHFFKSVSTIIDEFGDGAKDLAEYLYTYLKEDRGQIGRGETDITGALKFAREITDAVVDGDLSHIGVDVPASLMDHTDIYTHDGQQISVPNIRVMIYSDGAHGSTRNRVLSNAFDDLDPSPLMTAVIGNPDFSDMIQLGTEQMRQLATICPEHGQSGFFLIDEPDRYAALRNLFRMASGASGFCEECLKREVEAFENVS